jgi:hypothetical protein
MEQFALIVPNCSVSSEAVTLCDISSIPFNTSLQIYVMISPCPNGISKKEGWPACLVSSNTEPLELCIKVALPRKSAWVAWEIDVSWFQKLSMPFAPSGPGPSLPIVVGFLTSGMGEVMWAMFVVTDWIPPFVWTLS